MKFHATPIAGVLLIELEPVSDERGFFARTWCRKEFAKRGLNPHLDQCSISWNEKKGTLRGMHWQAAPHEETKLVRCTRGAIYDVALDVRPQSPTFKKWFAAELSARNCKMLYISAGCAHGYQTLEDDSEVFYQIAGEYSPPAARGVRFDDPAFGIAWPQCALMVSQRDREYSDFTL